MTDLTERLTAAATVAIADERPTLLGRAGDQADPGGPADAGGEGKLTCRTARAGRASSAIDSWAGSTA